MKHVMEALRKREAEEKLPVIRMEIDYELVTLHDAMIAEDVEKIKKTKKRLSELRKQLIEWSIE
ncbi:hypothetical protein [Halobacillus litoralis]|uniref:Uncharacterized protein n=1 Tax=Halobacillus litoralis TaxID=45668 RepID=A0A410M8U8_9BACI|nr:hypothetical protein [Halobacillus litoralis]QAS51145.1 hypothetical protein HLI_02450 [Halobacillus litoralis]